MANYSLFFEFTLKALEVLMDLYGEYWDHEDYNPDSSHPNLLTSNIEETLMVLSASSELVYMEMQEEEKIAEKDFRTFVHAKAKEALPTFKAETFLKFLAIVGGVAVQFHKHGKTSVPLTALKVVTQVMMIYDLNGTFKLNGGMKSIRTFCFDSEKP